MSGALYGVGVGPGDPGLLTLKAVQTIQNCGIIAVPDSGAGECAALTIAAEYIEGKRIVRCDMPMTRDEETLAKAREKAADHLCSILEYGENIAFLTLGDPSVYSTYMYIHRLVLNAGFIARMVPGVTSFCAAAAALNTSLCEGGEALHIIPATYGDISGALGLPGGKVLMKPGDTQEIAEALKEKGLLNRAKLVSRCGMAGETVAALSEMAETGVKPDYFTVIIVKGEEP